jgi:hypothetical protein
LRFNPRRLLAGQERTPGNADDDVGETPGCSENCWRAVAPSLSSIELAASFDLQIHTPVGHVSIESCRTVRLDAGP